MKTKLEDFLNEEKQTSPNPKTLTDLIYKIANTDKDGDFKLGNIKGSVVARNYGYWGYFNVDFYFKKDHPKFGETWDHFATWNQDTGGYEKGQLEVFDYEELIPVFKEAVKKAGFTRSELEIEGQEVQEVQESVKEDKIKYSNDWSPETPYSITVYMKGGDKEHLSWLDKENVEKFKRKYPKEVISVSKSNDGHYLDDED